MHISEKIITFAFKYKLGLNAFILVSWNRPKFPKCLRDKEQRFAPSGVSRLHLFEDNGFWTNRKKQISKNIANGFALFFFAKSLKVFARKFLNVMEKLHIGQLIHSKLIEEGRSISWFANQLNFRRPRVYKIFEESDINTGVLRRINRILNYNFFILLAECFEDSK